MKQSSGIIILIAIIIIAFYIFYKKKNEIYGEVTAEIGQDISNINNATAIAVKTYLGPVVDNIQKEYIDSNMILAVLCQETGQQIVAGKENKDIKGDGGKSYGYMQVQLVAMQQVNDTLNTSYNVSNLLNTYDNIEIGAKYLDLCMKQAYEEVEGYDNARYLAFRKYNSGINNAKPSNTISVKYADSAEKYYGYFTS